MHKNVRKGKRKMNFGQGIYTWLMTNIQPLVLGGIIIVGLVLLFKHKIAELIVFAIIAVIAVGFAKLSAPKNSNLKTVMDFSFYDKINIAKTEETETWFKGLDRVYNSFVYDFLYPNPESVLAFIENHDTDRFLGEGENLPMLKQASTLLLTTRRIPQLYYGTEIMMNGVKSKSDGYVRKDFPGGWADDKETALIAEGRSKIQNDCYNFYKTILNWRKGNNVIAKGSMTQFMVQNGVYAYARQYESKIVFVMLNGTDSETTVPLKFYKEILKDKKQGKDILSGKTILFEKELKMEARESLIIEL